jgi:hypothetical protein
MSSRMNSRTSSAPRTPPPSASRARGSRLSSWALAALGVVISGSAMPPLAAAPPPPVASFESLRLKRDLASDLLDSRFEVSADDRFSASLLLLRQGVTFQVVLHCAEGLRSTTHVLSNSVNIQILGDLAFASSGRDVVATWQEGAKTQVRWFRDCRPHGPLRTAAEDHGPADLAANPFAQGEVIGVMPRLTPGAGFDAIDLMRITADGVKLVRNLVPPADDRNFFGPRIGFAYVPERALLTFTEAARSGAESAVKAMRLTPMLVPVGQPRDLTTGLFAFAGESSHATLPDGTTLVAFTYAEPARPFTGRIGGRFVDAGTLEVKSAFDNLFAAFNAAANRAPEVQVAGASAFLLTAPVVGVKPYQTKQVMTVGADGQRSPVFTLDLGALGDEGASVVSGRALLSPTAELVVGLFDTTVPQTIRGVYAAPFRLPQPCVPADGGVCLASNRFRVDVVFAPKPAQIGRGTGSELTGDTGAFSFFTPGNVETVTKVVDGCAVNGRRWVFSAGLTNVTTLTTVTDSLTGASRIYVTPPGKPYAPVQDTGAFHCGPGGALTWEPGNVESATPGAARDEPGLVGPALAAADAVLAPKAACVPAPTRLCLGGGRFALNARWETRQGQKGDARAVAISDDTGWFWFFDPANVEILAKVLDGCALNSRFWAFAAGLTSLKVTLTVRDTATGAVRTYTNPQGTAFRPVQDTGAFGACS